MSETVIRVDDLSKYYRLGAIGGGTLSADLSRWWAKLRGKEDPMMKIGQAYSADNSEFIWALKNVSFDVREGEVLGIVGKNGAGKSTLLKILSRVTTPTSGSFKIKGRIASLLEVGTGFHPELSGRENIYLNGAILGMTKAEITGKLDEIIEFSEVRKFIDTPVKRYSSGMRVRLAFSVAAHLDPEILIIDEVLAVGDAEFQKKCLGKMGEVAKAGRTVLFVSHQLGMVKTLCTRSILMEKGRLVFEGNTESVIDRYLSSSLDEIDESPVLELPADESKAAQVTRARLSGNDGTPSLLYDVFDPVKLELEYILREQLSGASCIIDVERNGEILFSSFDTDRRPEWLNARHPGLYKMVVPLPSPLKAGIYVIHLRISRPNVGALFSYRNAFKFVIEERSFDPSLKSYSMKRQGKIAVDIPWEMVAHEPVHPMQFVSGK